MTEQWPPWYVVFSMAAIIPASFFSTVWLLGWLTNSDPLIEEIWRLRGQNSILRERLEQPEGRRKKDAEVYRDAPRPVMPPTTKTATVENIVNLKDYKPSGENNG